MVVGWRDCISMLADSRWWWGWRGKLVVGLLGLHISLSAFWGGWSAIFVRLERKRKEGVIRMCEVAFCRVVVVVRLQEKRGGVAWRGLGGVISDGGMNVNQSRS